MRFLLYTHSLRSDWNHGNAHFLRGVLGELESRGHRTRSLEPRQSWSRQNLLRDQGEAALARFDDDFPDLTAHAYDPDFDHEAALDAADIVIVHEWNDPALVARLGLRRRNGGRFILLFHDTHHRGVSDSDAIAGLALDDYDAVLAFGETLRARYLRAGWGRRVFTWHEAADTRLFRPHPAIRRERDLIWIGNWGDGERARELEEFLIEPARRLGLSGEVRGVRYPQSAIAALRDAGLGYGGWIANADAAQAFARHRMTVHVPRRPYAQSLPGIPTIRMFEALSCGIPLVSAPWDDCEGLFQVGQDYLVARDADQMAAHLRALRHEPDLGARLAAHGRAAIEARHSCAHRAGELLGIIARLDPGRSLQ